MNMKKHNQVFDELNKRAEISRTPLLMLFELTGCCNLNCKMCYVHNMDHVKAKSEELSTQQWKAIFDDAISAGMLFATLSGGECLLRNDFMELYLYLFERGIRISINSNGLLLNADMIAFFQEHPPETMQISLYGTSDEEYALATGVPAFSIVSKNLEALAHTKIDFSIAITPSVESKPFIKKVVEYSIAKKYRTRVSHLLISPREDVANDPSLLCSDDICSVMEYSALLKGRKLSKIPIELLPEAGTKGEGITEKYRCTAGLNRAQVDWRGVMHPCVALPSISCSLLDHTYADAWNYICEEIDKLAYPEKCATCCYKNACKPCRAARGLEGNYSVCNEQNCELVKNEISRGLLKFNLQNLE